MAFSVRHVNALCHDARNIFWSGLSVSAAWWEEPYGKGLDEQTLKTEKVREGGLEGRKRQGEGGEDRQSSSPPQKKDIIRKDKERR